MENGFSKNDLNEVLFALKRLSNLGRPSWRRDVSMTFSASDGVWHVSCAGYVLGVGPSMEAACLDFDRKWDEKFKGVR